MSNPISEEEFNEISEVFRKVKKSFIKRGYYSKTNLAKEESAFTQLKAVGAMAYNLAEFKALLEELLSINHNISFGEVDSWLAHENAHMNIAESTGHKVIGYGLIFLKTFSFFEVVQPFCLYKSDISWGPKENLEKDSLVADAPRVYGDKLSEGDEKVIVENQELLGKINAKS